jgi:type II restriction/modification system DNA methylase subunit YeeA
MDADTFIKRWDASTRNETAGSKPHFLDLCALLDVPLPTDDPTGAVYAFEKQAAKANGRKGWADVWFKDRFGWEYKSKGRDLKAAHDQLLRYAGALENPPLLITSDMARIVVRTNFTNTVTQATQIDLEALRDASTRDRLRDCWLAPDRWKPGTTRQALTERAAGDFAELAERLRKRGHAPGAVAHFVNRLVFCLFANDVRLLPNGMLGELLALAQKEPDSFADSAGMLFRAMSERGGRIGFRPVHWFNGGLFDDDATLPLTANDIALLNKAATNDWSQVDPSIFGTLFERGLDPSKRSQLGAHYTDRAKIELLVQAVITRPLIAEWEAVRAGMAIAMAERVTALKEIAPASDAALVIAKADAITAETKAARKNIYRAAERRDRKAAAFLASADGAYRTFLKRLRDFRVLDPACGSGNFLYVSMLALKDLELRVSVDAEAMGLEPSLPSIGPESVLGIEVNSFAAELARVSVWIGHIQWARNHAYPVPSNPVLRKLDTIECRDAVMAESGAQATWPTADAIVGNPPFLGGKRLRSVLGDTYCDRLFAAYVGYVSAEADLVCYWFVRAQEAIVAGRVACAGLVATNSIRGGVNRRILDQIVKTGTISTAWADEPWTLDGAAVRVSLVCWGRERAIAPVLDGVVVPAIHADLTAYPADLTTARRIPSNAKLCFQGPVKVGAFDVAGSLARKWLTAPTNSNGRPNSDVVRPLANGIDISRRWTDTWIVDFSSCSEAEAAFYAEPFSHVVLNVKPIRDRNRDTQRRERWWLLGRSGADLQEGLSRLPRYVVTVRHSRHRLFVWLKAPTLPDSALIAFARDDDTSFGILHSRFHELWALRMGSALEDRPRYTPSTTFETFPFPDGLTPNQSASAYAGDPRACRIADAARAIVKAREHWLTPPELVMHTPEVVPGFPDGLLPRNAAAETTLRDRTLTNLYNQRGVPQGAWLDNLHRALDEAVAAAYGWPADLNENEVLARLLALNLERAAAVNH